MHVVEVLSGGVGLILGCMLGIWLAKRKAPNYDALKAQHDAYRNDVESHFEKTAQLAHQMAEDYRKMYQHLAQGAVHLCDVEAEPTKPSLVALRRHVEQQTETESPNAVIPGASKDS